MRATILVVLSLFVLGCSSNQPSIEERQNKSETKINTLLGDAKRIRVDLVKSKDECQEMILRSQEKIANADAMLTKLDALLGGKPLPVVPVPQPVNPSPGPQPVPTPEPLTPVPSPSPTPTEPEDGPFAVAKAVYRIAMAVESPDRVAESQALATVFESVGAQVAAGALDGTLLDPQWHRISVALTAGNKPVIAKHLAAWDNPATQLSKAIGKNYKENKLPDNKAWAELLREISRGLKAVR